MECRGGWMNGLLIITAVYNVILSQREMCCMWKFIVLTKEPFQFLLYLFMPTCFAWYFVSLVLWANGCLFSNLHWCFKCLKCLRIYCSWINLFCLLKRIFVHLWAESWVCNRIKSSHYIFNLCEFNYVLSAKKQTQKKVVGDYAARRWSSKTWYTSFSNHLRSTFTHICMLCTFAHWPKSFSWLQ